MIAWYYWPGLIISIICTLGLIGVLLFSIWQLIDMIPWYRARWIICRIFGHRKPWMSWMDDRLEVPAFVGCNFCGAHNVPASGRG